MALCVYHETVEATSTCIVCKQDICGKCAEFGEDGMCGMCLEMANARRASAEANRQARRDAPAPTGAPAQARPAGARPPAPGTRPPQAGPAGRTTANLRPPGAKSPTKPPPPPGMCGDHHDQKASAMCTHCRKKVCPYCLDLYDLCTDCRTLDRCARHESMVAGEKCSACKLPFCRICLDNTDRCDRCRTLGRVGTDKMGAKSGAIRPPAKGTTGKLPPQEGQPAAGGPKKDGPPRPSRPPVQVRKAAAPYKPPAKKGGPMGLIVGGVAVVVACGVFFMWGASKPSLSDDEALRYLNEEMAYIQKAAIAIKEKRGAYPDTEEQILAEVAAQGVVVDKLPLPIKLVVNGDAMEPLQISYRLVGSGFEVRALDPEGRPLSVNGRDVILRDVSAESGTDSGTEPAADSGASPASP